MPPNRPLKVFRTHLGFFDTIVAVPSMKAALDAWGVKQNLFQGKLAELTNDPKAVMAALAKPGVVLRRAAGSNDQFTENPDLPMVRIAKKAKAAKAAKESGQHRLPLSKPEPKPVDRRKLEAAEKALADLEQDERRTLGELWKKRAAAEAEEARAKRDFARRRREAEEKVEQEQRAYDRAVRERDRR
jgi:colicin import membrane protein